MSRMRDIGPLIDNGAWSGYQKLLLLLVSLAVLLDGFDNQSLGFTLPSILQDWGLAKADLAPALAAAQFGMLIGAIGGGAVGDRVGRKIALVASTVLFGVTTLMIGFADSPLHLVILRFVAGIGMGAAFPNVAALASEFTPARHRSLAVVISIVCVPLGGVIGGMAASVIMPLYGWRAVFLMAGVATMVIAVLLIVGLPESVRFLNSKGGQDDKVRAILRRMGIAADEQTRAVRDEKDETDPTVVNASILGRDLRSDTLFLWIAFFFSLVSVYAAFNWLPTLLVESGHDIAVASRGLAAFNMGGVATALLAGWAIGRFGSKRTTVAMAVAAAIAALLLAVVPGYTGSVSVLFILLALEGGFINGVQTTLYAVASHIYPTAVRARGVGTATGLGRTGAVTSSLLGAAVIGVGGAVAFHWSIAAVMLIVAGSLIMIKRHSTPSRR